MKPILPGLCTVTPPVLPNDPGTAAGDVIAKVTKSMRNSWDSLEHVEWWHSNQDPWITWDPRVFKAYLVNIVLLRYNALALTEPRITGLNKFQLWHLRLDLQS